MADKRPLSVKHEDWEAKEIWQDFGEVYCLTFKYQGKMKGHAFSKTRVNKADLEKRLIAFIKICEEFGKNGKYPA